MALSRTYHHYDTFREELAKAYPAFGHALWEPNPGEYPPVEVGDVGFIRQGKFHRLFNALHSENHPSNQRFGVPEDHEQLQPVPNHIDRGALNPNTFYSYGVSVVSGGLEALSAGSIGSAEVSFSCTKKQGAVLTLPVTAQREDTLTQDHFREWIIMHVDSWFAFTQKLRLGIGMGDIILVTGCHRTRSWSNITFNEVQTNAQFSLGVEVAGAFGANVNWRASSLRIQGAVPNHGPSGENLPESQCIFIRGFRIKRTFLGKIPRIKAAAEPKPDPRDPESEPEPEEEVVSIPSVTEYKDPLHVLLEYIVKHAPTCDMALVHDDDLERILGVGDGVSLEFSRPDMVTDYLERSKVEVIESRPLPTNNQSPGTYTDITVAMLPAELKNIADTVQRAPPYDMDFVRDEDWKRLLTGDRTGVMSSLSSRPANDNGLRESTKHMTVAMPSLGLKGLAGTPSDVDHHPCQACGIRFVRRQELRRHEIDVHSPPRQCLFCLYQWKRPDKIKAHLVDVHRDVLSPEVLNGISTLRGQRIVEFLETYEHLRHDVISQAGGSSTPLFPAATKTTKRPILPDPRPDYDMPQTPPATPRATSLHWDD